MKTPPTHPNAAQRQGRFFIRLAVIAVVVFVMPAVDAADSPPAAPPGKKLYEAKCLRCHKDLDPTIYEDMTWKRWLWKMKDKARLDNEEYGDLSDYLKGVREAAKSKKTK